MSPYRVMRPDNPRPDASMDLLNQILREPVDPDYAVVAGRARQPRRRPLLMVLVAVASGLMFASGGMATWRSQPTIAKEREQLIVRIRAEEQHHQELAASIEKTTGEIADLQQAALGSEAGGYQSALEGLGTATGATPVRGPGVVVVVDDAENATSKTSQVLDVDLRQAVNGLWASGAEAIAINGHRLSARTAIRGAGDAITVDYISLTRPYTVEAIGDPKTLEARFIGSAGGTWWSHLRANYGMTFRVSTVDEVRLPGDPGLGLQNAKKPR